MNDVAIKNDLIDRIEHASQREVREIYGLVLNYLNGNDDLEEWDLMPEIQQKLVLKSIEQSDAGLGTPVEEVTERLRLKYGLNG